MDKRTLIQLNQLLTNMNVKPIDRYLATNKGRRAYTAYKYYIAGVNSEENVMFIVWFVEGTRQCPFRVPVPVRFVANMGQNKITVPSLVLGLFPMGRITIFALTDCPHCVRTKAALTRQGIPYSEINLSTHPYKRKDMLQLSDRLTVPQVFFNERHVGGADETLALLQQWQDEIDNNNNNNSTTMHKTLLERYQAEIEAPPDPTDVRLQVPTEPPIEEEEPDAVYLRHPTDDAMMIHLPGTSTIKLPVREVMERLRACLPIQDRKYRFTFYKQCFTGHDLIKALMDNFSFADTSVAIQFANQQLQRDYQIVGHVVAGDVHDVDDSEQYYFRLQCHQTPLILNSYCIWKKKESPQQGDQDDRIAKYPMALLKHCKSLWSQVAKAVTDDQGRIDYKRAPTLEQYAVFEEAVCELQCVEWSNMDRNTKLAFGINLYNLMIPYAFAKVGIATSTFARGAFFNSVSMNIGGYVLSFSELENGVLRGNRRAPYAFSVPFQKDDPRLGLALDNDMVDERIHFALNCGATSCPPVKAYTVSDIDDELRIVAMAFCEQDSNVLVDVNQRTLHLSAIFKWYRVDFDKSASDNNVLANKVVEYLRGAKREQVQSILTSKNKNQAITVQYLPYDWSTNASDFIPFDKSQHKPNVTTIMALFS